MKKKLVFATNNAHKLDEISSILGEKVELLSLKDIHCHVDIPETADTLEETDMQGVQNRKAQFRTAICLILDGKKHLFEGIVKGEIIKEKRGSSGFGYDPIFVPEGYTKTFAELGNETKNKISHRALAVEKLCRFLKA